MMSTRYFSCCPLHTSLWFNRGLCTSIPDQAVFTWSSCCLFPPFPQEWTTKKVWWAEVFTEEDWGGSVQPLLAGPKAGRNGNLWLRQWRFILTDIPVIYFLYLLSTEISTGMNKYIKLHVTWSTWSFRIFWCQRVFIAVMFSFFSHLYTLGKDCP